MRTASCVYLTAASTRLKIAYVTCVDVRDVAQAITDMVTQSAGPYTAAGMGMALAASKCANRRESEQMAYLEEAAETLSTARPTTEPRMRKITQGALRAAADAFTSRRERRLRYAI